MGEGPETPRPCVLPKAERILEGVLREASTPGKFSGAFPTGVEVSGACIGDATQCLPQLGGLKARPMHSVPTSSCSAHQGDECAPTTFRWSWCAAARNSEQERQRAQAPKCHSQSSAHAYIKKEQTDDGTSARGGGGTNAVPHCKIVTSRHLRRELGHFLNGFSGDEVDCGPVVASHHRKQPLLLATTVYVQCWSAILSARFESSWRTAHRDAG